jgi:hypothetical protein
VQRKTPRLEKAEANVEFVIQDVEKVVFVLPSSTVRRMKCTILQWDGKVARIRRWSSHRITLRWTLDKQEKGWIVDGNGSEL